MPCGTVAGGVRGRDTPLRRRAPPSLRSTFIRGFTRFVSPAPRHQRVVDCRHPPFRHASPTISAVPDDLTPLQRQLRDIFDRRDRNHMRPTIEAFLQVLETHPEDPEVLYEVAGSYDTAGQEEIAADYYERALAAGLSDATLCRCLLQYGSTLRNLDRAAESLAVFADPRRQFPSSDSLRNFEAFSLDAAGRPHAAMAALLELIADRIGTPEVKRYEAAIRGNAAYLADLDPTVEYRQSPEPRSSGSPG